jgi:dienelactone hydrolase
MTAARWRVLGYVVGAIACAVAAVIIVNNRHGTSKPAPLTLPPPVYEPNDPAPLEDPSLAVGPAPDAGVTGATVIRPNDTKRHPVLIFFHGYGSVSPQAYAAWTAHLAHEGFYVIYPTYQGPGVKQSQTLQNAIQGVVGALKLGFQAKLVQPGKVVVVGHSAGATLAADYASGAAGIGLPAARIVYSVYPGTKLPGWTSSIPIVRFSKMPADTRLRVLVGATDATVGQATGQLIYDRAKKVTDKQLITVTAKVVSDHTGPYLTGPGAQKAFWAPLDQLIKSAG